MNNEFRRDQICTTWTQEQWNAMCKAAQSGQKTPEIEQWNNLYNTVVSKSTDIVKEYNDNYNKTSFPNLVLGGNA